MVWWQLQKNKNKKKNHVASYGSGNGSVPSISPGIENLDTSSKPAKNEKLAAVIRLALFIFLLVYPRIRSLLAQFFQCQQVDGESYLVADYSVHRYDSQWKKMLVVEAVLVLVYPLGGILGIFLLLKYKRAEVNVQFMTAQYKPEYYYWDVVEMLRKLAILAAVVWDQYRQVERSAQFECDSVCKLILSLFFFFSNQIFHGIQQRLLQFRLPSSSCTFKCNHTTPLKRTCCSLARFLVFV